MANPITQRLSNRAVAMHMSVTAAACIVSPGRLVVAFVLAAEEVILSTLCALFISLLDTLEVKQIKESCICLFVVMFVILYKEILSAWMPAVALQLSFVLFLPAISTFSTAFLIDDKSDNLLTRLSAVIPAHLVFAFYIIIFCAIRDIIGFGTITLPKMGGVMEIVLCKNAPGSFLATIPGALMLSALILASFLVIEHWYFSVKGR